MPIYILKNKNDEAAFTSLTFILDTNRIEFVDAKMLKIGEDSGRFEICLSLLSQNTIHSASFWSAIGTFYAANVRIFFLVFASDLTDQEVVEIPPQFRDMIYWDLKLLIEDLKKEISERSAKKTANVEEKRKAEALLEAPLISQLTIENFFNFITSSTIRSKESLAHVILLVRECFYERAGEDYSEPVFNQTDLLCFCLPLMNSLLGAKKVEVLKLGQRFWEGGNFFLSSSTGEWVGFSRERRFSGGFGNCLLLHFSDSSVDAAVDSAVLTPGVGYYSLNYDEETILGYEPLIASCGNIALGELSELKPDNKFLAGSIPLFGG